MGIVDEWIEIHNACNWTTFDTYIKAESAIYSVNINTSDWTLSQCSCAWYKKNKICKHVIGISAKLKLCNFPLVAMQIPLGQKRKRGRPEGTKKALLIQ